MMLLLVLLLVAAPPDTLTLDQCYREAEAHYPRRQELALQDAISALRVRSLGTRFLPSLALTGQASYQSDVAEIPLDMSGGAAPPQVSRDQYKAGLTVEQLFYDGGLKGQQKTLEAVQRDLGRQEIEVELYALRDRVNAVFFGVLLSQARLASLRALEEDLRARLGQVEARVRQGVLLASNTDVLAVERLKGEQQLAEAEADRRGALAVLGVLMGRPLPEDVALSVPTVAVPDAGPEDRKRPEYGVFDLMQDRLTGLQTLVARRNRPNVVGFAEAAYGRPQGLNFFETAFGPFYSFGVRVRWPFSGWQTRRYEHQALDLQQQAVAAQEATFTQRLQAAAAQQRSDIARLRELLARDDEIIARREAITARAASQLDNGTLTATDYLIERNAEHQARLVRALHRVQLVQAQVLFLTTIGDLP